MLKNELDKIYKELIEYSKSKFLKAEIKEAYFHWHENPYSNRELEYLDKNCLEFKTFIDWFIFDYTLISLKKTLATIYWEENKDNLDSNLINSQRSLFKLVEKNIKGFNKLKDLITNKTIELEFNSNTITESNIISLRVIKIQNEYFNIGDIVIYDTTYNKIIEKVIREHNKTKKSLKIVSDLILKNINKETIRIDNALKHEILNEKKELYITNYKKVKELLEESTYLKLISKDRSTKIFNYFINDEYQPGSVELTRKKIFIINLSEELKEKLVHDLKDVTSEVNDNESIRLSESWINKSLLILDNKTPLEASSENKYKEKIEKIVHDLELIFESREFEEELSIDPYYVKKRLKL